MVDSDRVHRLLAEITKRLARLAQHAQRDRDDLLADETTLESTKYLLATAVEAAIDVAQHLCASEGWSAPDTNAAAFVALGRHGVIDRPLAQEMVAANGLRNVLIHGYAEVDDVRVLDALADPRRLERFVAAVSAWLLEQGG